MWERTFWKLIGRLDWDRLGDDDAVIEPVVQALSKRSEKTIFGFEELLAQKLHGLDTEAHARCTGETAYKGPDEFFSVDCFLYDRCCVVANGKEFYERVLASPSMFPQDAEFEPLLYIGSKAYERKTGKEFDYVTTISYETYSNLPGWLQ